MSHEFINRAAFLEGKIQLYFSWDYLTGLQIIGPTETKDIRKIPMLTNFAGGGGSILQAGPIVPSGTKGTGSIFYVGAFKQKLQEICFPFDHVEVAFNVEILRPFSDSVRIGLFCECDGVCGDECIAYNATGQKIADGQEAVKIVRKDTVGLSVGFDWDVFTCEAQGGTKLTCSMTGIRDPELIIMSDLVPGIVMVIVGFSAVWMPSGGPFAMPRIATTMIAMLSFIAKGSAVMSRAPATGGLSWLAHFFVAGVFVMLIVMLGHIQAFKSGHEHLFLRIFNRYFNFFGYIFFLFVDLTSRNCAHVPSAVPIVGVVMFALLVALTVGCTVRRHRAEIEKFMKLKPAKKDDPSLIESTQKDDPLAPPPPPPPLPPPLAPPPAPAEEVDTVKQVAAAVADVEGRYSDLEAQLSRSRGELTQCRSDYEKKLSALSEQLREAETRCTDAETRCSDAELRLVRRQGQQGENLNVPDFNVFETQLQALRLQLKDAEARCADAEVRCVIGQMSRWADDM